MTQIVKPYGAEIRTHASHSCHSQAASLTITFEDPLGALNIGAQTETSAIANPVVVELKSESPLILLI